MNISNQKINFAHRDKVIKLLDSLHDADIWVIELDKNMIAFDVRQCSDIPYYEMPHKKMILMFKGNVFDDILIYAFRIRGKMKGELFDKRKIKSVINRRIQLYECYINKNELQLHFSGVGKRYETLCICFTNLESIEIADIDESEIVEKPKSV